MERSSESGGLALCFTTYHSMSTSHVMLVLSLPLRKSTSSLWTLSKGFAPRAQESASSTRLCTAGMQSRRAMIVSELSMADKLYGCRLPAVLTRS